MSDQDGEEGFGEEYVEDFDGDDEFEQEYSDDGTGVQLTGGHDADIAAIRAANCGASETVANQEAAVSAIQSLAASTFRKEHQPASVSTVGL